MHQNLQRIFPVLKGQLEPRTAESAEVLSTYNWKLCCSVRAFPQHQVAHLLTASEPTRSGLRRNLNPPNRKKSVQKNLHTSAKRVHFSGSLCWVQASGYLSLPAYFREVKPCHHHLQKRGLIGNMPSSLWRHLSDFSLNIRWRGCSTFLLLPTQNPSGFCLPPILPA